MIFFEVHVAEHQSVAKTVLGDCPTGLVQLDDPNKIGVKDGLVQSSSPFFCNINMMWFKELVPKYPVCLVLQNSKRTS